MIESDNETNSVITPESGNENTIRKVLSPGTMLRQKREESELKLNDIARDLNLDPWMLNAIEADEFSQFGAQVFAKGHLKHYAQHLGLNPDDVLFAYYQVAAPKETTPVIKQSLSSTKQTKSYAKVSKWFVRLLGLLAIGALAYAAVQGVQWWLNDAKDSVNNEEVIPVPGVNQSTDISSNSGSGLSSSGQITLPVQNDVSVSSQNDNTQDDNLSNNSMATDLSESDTNVATADNTNADNNTDSRSNSSENTTTAAVATNNPTNAVSGKNTLRFNFTESSWVEVFAEDGKRLMYGMANQGTVRDIAFSGSTEIFLGNADGTVISLNGETYNVPANAKAGRTARFVLDIDQ